MKARQKNDAGNRNISATTGSKKRLVILDSFEQMNETDIQEMADTLPVDRIRNSVELILRAHGVTREQLLKKGRSTKVEIIRTS